MNYKTITISREHGSGGRTIAEKVADKLGLKLYDKLLISMLAKESGLSETYIKETDMKRIFSFFYNVSFSSRNLPLEDQLFIFQSNLIKDVYRKEPALIVGRCSDYVLRDEKDVLNVFIYAPMEEKAVRASKEYGETGEKDAVKYLEKCDRQRAQYYMHYAGRKWGDRANYQLMIDSSIGIDETVALIVKAYLGEVV